MHKETPQTQHELLCILLYTAVVQPIWKQAGIAIATLLGLSLSGALLWVLYAPAIVPPERFLPQNTVAVVSGADQQSIASLKSLLPVLQTLPTPQPGATFALIKVQNGTEWITLMPSRGLQGNPYVITSSAQAKATLQTSTGSLEQFKPFAALHAERHGGTWTYINPSLLPENQSALPWSSLIIQSPLSLGFARDTLEISIVAEPISVLPTLGFQLPSAFEQSLMVIHAREGMGLLSNASSSVQPSTAFLWESLIRDFAEDAFGKELSVTYDILPLLSGETTLHVGKEHNGSQKHFLIEGETGSHEASLQTILDSFEASLPSYKRETLTFDRGFISDTLAQDSDVIERRDIRMEGWDVHAITHTQTKRSLALALKGDAFILSNSLEALKSRLDRSIPPVSVRRIKGALVAAGIADRNEGSALALRALPGFSSSGSTLLPQSLGDRPLWVLSRQRGLFTLRIEPSLVSPPGPVSGSGAW